MWFCSARYFVFLLLVLMGKLSFSQQEPLYTQVRNNLVVINPAYNGIKDGVQFNAAYRNQWSGVAGSPETQFFSVHTPIQKQKAGFGALVYRDVLGISTSNNLKLSYAYQLQFKDDNYVRVGVSGGFRSIEQNWSEINPTDADDPIFNRASTSTIDPMAGFGIYWYNKNYYLGFSLPNFTFEPQFVETSLLLPHYYFQGGAIFEISEEVTLKPFGVVRKSHGARWEFESSLEVIWNDLLKGAIGGRSNDGLQTYLQVKALSNFWVGFGMDFSTVKNSNQFGTTQEFFLSYLFKSSKAKTIHPRYF